MLNKEKHKEKRPPIKFTEQKSALFAYGQPPEPQGPPLDRCFPAGQPPALTGTWGNSSPGAGICDSLY